MRSQKSKESQKSQKSQKSHNGSGKMGNEYAKLKKQRCLQLVQECAKELPPEAWSRACFPFVRSVDSVFTQYQKAVVPEQFSKVLYNGNRIEPEMIRSFEASMQQKPIRIYDEKDHFIGIYEFQQERGNFKPVKVFMEE